ncbi:MAG: nodulation protein NfeD [Oleiphilaceae bacterium]|nr:nodulation protein NfeD [Oleiphilaceae bacterium]
MQHRFKGPDRIPLSWIRKAAILCLLALGSLSLLAGASDDNGQGDGARPDVWVMTLDGAIGPASASWFIRTLESAEKADADLLVLELDTPGGLDSAMRDMIQKILDSRVPVATYVTPSGARAASAGTYILYGSHVAAMAPATNLGSATPVQMGGGGGGDQDDGGFPMSLGRVLPAQASNDSGADATGNDSASNGDSPKEEGEDGAAADQDEMSAMEKKVINDAVAYIRGLAQLRGRNADWAEQAVREAVSLSSSEALEKNVIDIRADTLDNLMTQAHGMEVDMGDTMRTLDLENAVFNRIEKDWRTQFLTVITNPSVAYILMLIGIYGLILEFYNPGMGVPGVVGAISLLLGLYALQMLPISFVGLGLMLLGIALMAVEAFAPSFGIFGLGGAAAFVVGSIMLMDTDVPGYQIAMPLIAAVAVSTVVIMIFVLRMALQARKRTVVSGAEGMIGSSAEAVEDFTGEGHVRAWGEIWKASTSSSPVHKGDRLRITEVDGLKLKVTPEDNP